jgi:cytochrome b involved in lipid metabolism
VASHCTQDSCWMVVDDKVYDLTDFLDFHPAGTEIMLEHAGTDASTAFFEKGHSIGAQLMLEKYYIGELTKVVLAKFIFIIFFSCYSNLTQFR